MSTVLHHLILLGCATAIAGCDAPEPPAVATTQTEQGPAPTPPVIAKPTTRVVAPPPPRPGADREPSLSVPAPGTPPGAVVSFEDRMTQTEVPVDDVAVISAGSRPVPTTAPATDGPSHPDPAGGPSASSSGSGAGGPAAAPAAADPKPVADAAPPDPALTTTVSVVAAPPPDVPAPVVDLLDRLEAGAADLEGFTANIRYTKESVLLDRKETRGGKIIYQVDREAGRKRFAILFDELILARRLERGRLQHYVFDGRWLAEIDHTRKQFIKREIVPPGRTLDPLKLGEGPIPLPIGQARDDVLARFEVTLIEPPPDGPLGDLGDVEGVRLVPRPDTPEAEEFDQVDIFHDPATLLPVGIVAVEVNGDRKIVNLTDLQRNPVLDAEALQRLSIDDPDPTKWRIDVRPWGER